MCRGFKSEPEPGEAIANSICVDDDRCIVQITTCIKLSLCSIMRLPLGK